MMKDRVARTLIPFLFGALAVSSGQAFAQDQPGQERQQQEVRQLSDKAQKATARLHALSQARAAYASAAAQRAQDPQAKEFLQGRAEDYMKFDERIVSFAQAYNVDLGSKPMQKEIQKYQKDWIRKIEELQKAEPQKTARMALETFTERNEKAVEDLETLQKEVDNREVTEMTEEMISSLEGETSRAEKIRQQMKTAMKQKE